MQTTKNSDNLSRVGRGTSMLMHHRRKTSIDGHQQRQPDGVEPIDGHQRRQPGGVEPIDGHQRHQPDGVEPIDGHQLHQPGGVGPIDVHQRPKPDGVGLTDVHQRYFYTKPTGSASKEPVRRRCCALCANA